MPRHGASWIEAHLESSYRAVIIHMAPMTDEVSSAVIRVAAESTPLRVTHIFLSFFSPKGLFFQLYDDTRGECRVALKYCPPGSYYYHNTHTSERACEKRPSDELLMCFESNLKKERPQRLIYGRGSL
jgi:hypothetical protein